uniref:Chromosome 5 open reading frame 58 n=1 Tax=Aotus nancymaae TaxID=37293 RepID=A0A2K5CUE3_AOTNA
MDKKSVTDHKLHVDKTIKNINTISLELKKMKVN